MSTGRPRLFFRADASPEVGLGHVRRCAVLAQACRERGAEVHLIARWREVSRESAGDWRGVVVHELPWEVAVEQDAEMTVAICEREKVMTGVVDHYRQTEAYQLRLLEAGLKWMQFYNPSLGIPFLGQLRHEAASDPSVALVGASFARERERMPRWEEREDILITFGGGDDRGAVNAALELVEAAGWAGDRVVLTTRLNPRLREIRGGRVVLDDFEPAARMARCRVALCAGGTTLYELATLGVPALIISIAENQVAPALAWEKAGRGKYLGPLGGELRGLEEGQLAEWSRNCLAAVDGRGAGRTAERLLELAETCL